MASEERPNYAIVAAIFALCLALVAIAIAYPRDRFLLVVVDPEASPSTMMNVIERAGGAYVSATRFDWLAVAYSDQADFAERLLSGGAILVLNHALAAGCTERND